jgi:opacity protein-like surface antigen
MGIGASVLNAQSVSVFALGSGSSLFNTQFVQGFTGSTFSRYQPGEGFTVGTEFRFVKLFGIEGSYYLGRNSLEIFGQQPTYGIREQRLSGDFVLHSPMTFFHLNPYVVAGPEYDNFSPMGTTSEDAENPLYSSNKIGYNFGGGVDLKLAHRFALRLDVRDHGFGSPNYKLPASLFPSGGFAQNLVYSLGVVYRFRK